VDVRVLSATNADVAAEVRAGRFREDLLFRLNTVEIRLPPLRERQEDIPALAMHFLRSHATRYRKDIEGFAPEALDALLRHPWPGNVRELDHAIERAALLAEGPTVRAADLGLAPDIAEEGTRIDAMTLADVEAHLIRRALDRAGGNVTDAARALGLSRSALYRRLEKLDH
jgi:DNA-binding NtrC family response regulator